MKKLFLIFATVLFYYNSYTQVGIGTTSPNQTAALDIASTSKGFLPPRMTEIQRNSIVNPAQGLLIYNLSVPCLQVNDGTPSNPVWTCLSGINSGVSKMTQHQFNSTSNGRFGFWLYTPPNATPGMPLIVYLHGGSGRGTDLNLVIGGSLPKFLYDKEIADVPAYILMPQCPTVNTWEQITTPINELIDSLVAAKAINIDKISVTGHSLGGTGVWKYGALFSNKFSCIAPLSGSVQTNTASSYINIPVWAFVGSADTVVDPSSSTTIVPLINNAGGNAQIKIYNGATHFDVPDLTYKDAAANLLLWLISINR